MFKPDRHSLLALLLSLPMIVWGSLALYFLTPAPWSTVAAAGFALLFAACFVLAHSWKKAMALSAVLFSSVVVFFLVQEPSNDRHWQPDVAVLPYSTREDDRITIHNIRNCDYRTETDFTVHYYDRAFDLAALSSIDLFLVNWGIESVAHTMVSFGFDDGAHVAVSIETRKEVGEEYSTLKGFFRQYELMYVVADERDVIRLRTNYRQGETVYLYRVKAEKELIRQVFLDYLQTINQLKVTPVWYNALLTNCTTQLRGHTRPYFRKVVWDWRVLANGYSDALAYEKGTLDNSLPFAELKKRSVINEKARAADQDPAFSLRIREGLPGISPATTLHP